MVFPSTCIAYKILRCTGFKPSLASGRGTLLNNIFTISPKRSPSTSSRGKSRNFSVRSSLSPPQRPLYFHFPKYFSSSNPNATLLSIHFRRGSTLSPIKVVIRRSALATSSILTRINVRVSGSIVVSHS